MNNRPMLAVVLIAATTLAADAQAMPAIPPPFSSQPNAPSTAPSGGLSEQGRGIVPVAADRLRLTVHIFNVGPVPTPPAFAMTNPPPVHPKATLEDVVAAMRANGIPDARIVSPVFGGFGNGDQITGTILKPTQANVTDIERRVLAALPSTAFAAQRNVNVNGTLEADDCANALRRARELAFADARKRAESLASIAGVRLAGLVAASEFDQTLGCAKSGGFTGIFLNGGDAAMKFDIDVSAVVNATFAIRH